MIRRPVVSTLVLAWVIAVAGGVSAQTAAPPAAPAVAAAPLSATSAASPGTAKSKVAKTKPPLSCADQCRKAGRVATKSCVKAGGEKEQCKAKGKTRRLDCRKECKEPAPAGTAADAAQPPAKL